MLAKNIRQIISSLRGEKKPKVYKKNASKLLRGALYLYRYSNPKYKKVLPYYDARPLVILLEFNATHFLGINCHFIPWTYRVQFVKKVIQRIRYKNRIKYSDIKRAAESVRMPQVYAYFAIRKYIRSRIGSDLYKFDFENWRLATMDIQPNFKKAEDTEIYREMNKKVRNLRKQKKIKK